MKKEHTLGLRELYENRNSAEKLIIMPYQQEDIEAHDHEFFELAYITGGSSLHTLNDDSIAVSAGDYFIVDYGSVHSYTSSRDFALINCLFLPEIIDDTLKGCISFEELMHGCLLRYYRTYLGRTPVNRIFRDEDGRVLQLLEGMMREYRNKQVGYTEIFRCRLLEILIIMMRHIVGDSSGITDNTVILDVIEYIKIHYAGQKLLDGFCKKHHFTPQYISRKFKQETGFTVSEYLQRVRMERCCEMLTGSSRPVSEIAQAVGYNDIKFFNKVFRRMLNMSPREYRKMSFHG
ncbi:AraC-like DNA-binding protein/quercetin dioxygenase-like cupin family protein [Anaerotaenia torta]|uniref:helix-turn-helix domain-containing protein n=1 Tax=Anaerotaenia torta TaxID=433293 RepID=UPI003D1BE3DC